MPDGVTMASEDAQKEAASANQLDSFLPLIRVRRDARRRYEIVGVYLDELVAVRKWKGNPVPESVHGPDGAGELRAIGEATGLGNAVFVNSVKRLVVEKRSVLRRSYRFRVTPTQGRRFEFRVLAHETPSLIRGLAGLIGPQLDQRRWIRFPASPMRFGVVLLIVTIALALYLLARSDMGSYFLGPFYSKELALALSWAFLFFLPTWLLFETLDVIPWAYIEKQKKVSWGKDQSWRRPFHSRVTGGVLRFVGTILLLGWLGNVSLTLYESFTPRPPRGASVTVLTSVFNFAWLVLGSSLIYLGHSAGSKTARQDTASDPRPHTLYLRSFLDDDANNLNPRTPLAAACGLSTPWPFVLLPFPLRHIFNLHPLRVLRAALGTLNDSSEQHCADISANSGPS